MPHARVSTHVHSPSVDVIVDMGHPLLNRTVDGFLKIGAVGATHAAAQDIFASLKKESVTKHDLQRTVVPMFIYIVEQTFSLLYHLAGCLVFFVLNLILHR